MSGYVRMHRALIGHPAFRNDGEALAFAWMVMRAAWKPCRVRYKGKSIDLKRGQLAISIRDLSEALDRPKGWVERYVNRARDETMIGTDSKTGVLIITICNYDKYQASSDDRETASETPENMNAGHAQDTEQVREEIRIGSEAKASSPKRERVADLFPCPTGVDPLDWSSLLEFRKASKKSMNAGAYRQIVAKLARWSDAGWPPGPFVATAVERGWLTVFETDEMKNGHLGRNDRSASPSRAGGGTIRDAAADVYAELAASGNLRSGLGCQPAINGGGAGGIRSLPAPDRAVRHEPGGAQGMAPYRAA